MTPPLDSTQMMDVDPAKLEGSMRPEQQPWFERANRRTRDAYGDRPTSTTYDRRTRETWLRRGASELEVDKLLHLSAAMQRDPSKMKEYLAYSDRMVARYGND